MEIRESTVKSLQSSFYILQNDLESLPEEAFTKSFGDKVRTVADIVYEINMVNDHIGMVIRGEEPFQWPEGDWIKAAPGFDTKETVLAAFKASAEKMIETAQSFSEEDLTTPFTTDEGETTRFERLRFVSLHNWYHSGQMNYIQTLFGDDKMNWK